MRRWAWIGVLLLVILVGVGIGAGAYNAGVSEGIEQGIAEAGRSVEVVRVLGPRYGHGFGFFPGFLFFPLFIIGIFLLVRAAFRRGPWGGRGPGRYGPGSWDKGAPPMFEEWHRHQHEQEGGPTAAGAEPA